VFKQKKEIEDEKRDEMSGERRKNKTKDWRRKKVEQNKQTKK